MVVEPLQDFGFVVRVLNLYAGLGGNRANWEGVEVTAVEYDPKIAEVYHDRFPEDELFVGDAHEFLEKNYSEFDFIWSSPPCQTHSSFRQNINVRFKGTEAKFPDMKLYQEIIFLKHNFESGKWVIENVNPYYDVLIEPSRKLGRHLFWSNFFIEPKVMKHSEKIREAQIPQLQAYHGIDLSNFDIANKRQILRNCVDREIGKHVWDCAKKSSQNIIQLPLFSAVN